MLFWQATFHTSVCIETVQWRKQTTRMWEKKKHQVLVEIWTGAVILKSKLRRLKRSRKNYRGPSTGILEWQECIFYCTDTSRVVSIAAVFTIARKRNYPRCTRHDYQIRNMWLICEMESHLDGKISETWTL